jgi:hypothetical protein
MAKVARDLSAGTLHPREALFIAGNLGSLNAEVITAADGCATVTLDLRGTFSLTIEVAGTVDGVNWTLIPMRPVNAASMLYVAAVVGTAAGVWVGQCAGYRQVRARVTAYTSGSATTTLVACTELYDPRLFGPVTTSGVSVVGASGAAVTLTMAAPGVGLRHYVTGFEITRYSAAALTASATPVTISTTNMLASLAYTLPADTQALGFASVFEKNFSPPLATNAQNTATTIVCPATTGVIWRVNSYFYVAP